MSARHAMRQMLKRAAITGGLEAAAAFSRAGLMGGARGRGLIFTLHHVRPKIARGFDPNGHLEVTPEFLDTAIRQLAAAGYRFAALADVPALLADDGDNRPFAVFTLDDGYRNNAEHALPVFARHGVPLTVFVCGGYADGTHSMWWETAAAMLTGQDTIALDLGSGRQRHDIASPAAKQAAFARIAEFVLRPGEADAVESLDRAAAELGIDPVAIARELTMRPEELRSLAAHPLASLGAHTISHRALALMAEDEARLEMAASAARVEAICGRPPATIAYPYGDARAAGPREFRLAADLGFRVGVTTQPATLTAADAGRPAGLPRVSLNGFYQKRRYVAALASGIPFRLRGRKG